MFRFFDPLPDELILQIFKNLSINALKKVACISKRFNTLAYDKSLSLINSKLLFAVFMALYATPTQIEKAVLRVKKLLLLGANPNMIVMDKLGDYHLLSYLAREASVCENGAFYIATAVIDAGANVNIRDVDGCTPLHFAAFYGSAKIAKLLIDYGADKTLVTRINRNAATLASRANFPYLSNAITTNTDWERAFEEEESRSFSRICLRYSPSY